MSTFWLSLLITGLAAGDVSSDAALSAAGAAVQRQDWPGAAAAYAQAAALTPRCGELEYDTGTAAANAGQVGVAVLHLERALRETPWDSDARTNLERIRLKRVDKVMGQEPGESPVQRLALGLPGRALFWLALALFWFGFGILVARTLGLALGAAFLGRGVAILVLGLAAVSFGASAIAEAERAEPYAVVQSPQGQGIKVHTGPAADLPSSFEVHDGLKVLVLDRENGFVHLRLGNGLEGYVAEAEVEAI